MTTDQRQRVRKLQDKLCTKAVGYKGVDEQACADCERPCGYGVELLSVLCVERVARAEPGGGIFRPAVVGMENSMRRVFRAINRKWR